MDDQIDASAPVDGLPLVHLVRQPLTEPASGARPPLLALAHGLNSNERDLFSLADTLAPRCVVVSVRAPLENAPGAYAWFGIQYSTHGTQVNAEQLDASRKRYADFLGAAVMAYGADPDQVYTLGFSQGAIISLVTALSHPRRFAGVVALSGRIPQEAEQWLASPNETAGLPVFMAHGTHDMTIAIAQARAARDLLERQRVDLTYREYPMGHGVSPEVYADMSAWLEQRLT
jgi:phospholipase/carboxylesterase